MKQFCEAAMNAGAKGVKIICSGRLAGTEIARSETQKTGSIPLHTLDADVDYATATARTTYGAIGVKVWIHRGKFGEQVEARPVHRRRRGPRRTAASAGVSAAEGGAARHESPGASQAEAAEGPVEPSGGQPDGAQTP